MPSERWKDYRDLRLEALKKDPAAFGSSFDEEEELSDQEWRDRCENAIFAFSNDAPVGMIVVFLLKKQKTRHIANIYGVYVKEEFRQQGIGSKLVAAAIFEIKKHEEIIKIDLGVNLLQEAAVGLYKKFGFAPVGILKKDLFVDGEYYDELVMEKFL